MTLQISDNNICRINNNKCTDNKCCSINSQCGEGMDYCNTNDIYNGDNAISNYNNLLNNDKQYIYDNNNNIILTKNGRCGIDLKNKLQIQCNNGMYCNNFSFCDESNDNVLKLNINNIPVSTKKYDGTNTFRNVKIEKKDFEISSDGKCGLKNNNKKCTPNQCCSKDGFCGNTKDHCYISNAENYENSINLNEIGVINKQYFSGDGALEEYDNILNKKLQNMYDTDNILLTKNGICGFNKDDEKVYKCLPEHCCSKNNICTIDLNYCNLEYEKLNGINIKTIDKNINKTNILNNFCGKDPLTGQIFKCNDDECCYRNKCGTSYDFCEFADVNNIYHGENALDNYKNIRISTDGTCNDKKCPEGECCSKTYKCGKGEEYCNNMNSKFNGFKSFQYKYDRDNFVTDLSLNICGIKDNDIYRCNPGYCCLNDGTCSLDCSNSFINIYDNDIIENITFYINEKSNILKLKINDLKDINSKFLNIIEIKSKQNYAVRSSNNKKYYNDDIFELINELLNKEYNRNKLNGDNAIANYINNKVLNTYNNAKKITSNTNNCYIDYKNNINYKCPPDTYCNYNNNKCSICNDKKNKIINGVILNKLDGYKYDLILFISLILFLIIYLLFYYLKNKNNIKNNIKKNIKKLF